MWTLYIGSLLLIAACCFAFYYFFVDANSFRWLATAGEPVYPEGFDVHGIDVSHYQEEIDWEVLRNSEFGNAAVSFVIIKATEGVDLMDENFNQNFYKAKQNDFVRGAYHFFNPNANPRKQADFFIKQVNLEPGDLPPILDVEKAGKLSAEELQKSVKVWLDVVEERYGVKPIIYSGYKFKMKYLDDAQFDDYPYWIAHYYVEKLQYKHKWSFWQHTDRGKIDGIKGNVDCDVFNGTMDDLMNMTIKYVSSSADFQ